MVDEVKLGNLLSEVDWLSMKDPCGYRIDLGQAIYRVATDDLTVTERRYFGTILYTHVSNQGSLGGNISGCCKVDNRYS